VLHIYNWADYVNPELVARFEAEHRCRVVIDTFDANEAMYAKLKAGASGYDLIFPSSYMAEVMAKEGLLLPLRHEWLPNLRHLDPAYLVRLPDPDCRHSVPYMMSYTGLAWRQGRLPDFTPSWTVFDRPELKGRMTLLDDRREVIGAALKVLGYSANTLDDAELAEAGDLVIRWKKNIAKFENEQYKNGIASGEFTVVMGYSGDLMQVIDEEPDVAFAVPVEGTQISCDVMVVPAGARQAELAHAFVNFLHDPAVAAENTTFLYYLCPNLPSYDLLDEGVRANPAVFVPAAVVERSEFLHDLGEGNAKYGRVWDAIKAAAD
jgi:spermidine/putrescine transport system substrate-binding protein